MARSDKPNPSNNKPFNTARVAAKVRRRPKPPVPGPGRARSLEPKAKPSAPPSASATLVRTLWGGGVALLFVAGLYALPTFPLVEVVTLGMIFAGTYEYLRFLERVRKDVSYGAPTALGSGCLIWLAALHSMELMAWAMAATMMLSHVVNLFYGRVSQYATRAALNQFASAYIALPLALMMRLYLAYRSAAAEGVSNVGAGLYFYPHIAPSALLFLLLLVWAGDTGAYFTGRNLGGAIWGRRKLAPRVSPNKTIEGFWGGVFATVAAAVLLQRFAMPPGIEAIFATPWTAALAGLLIGLAAPMGDLAESAIKRDVGVKDSGSFLPGHGGVLDRIDSLLFAAPVYVALCMWLLPPAALAFPK